MSDENTLWMLAVRLHHARRDSGRARRNDGINRRDIIHLREQLDLEIGTLGTVFLNEVRFRKRLFHICREREAIARRAFGKADVRQVFPGFVDVFAEIGFGVRSGIGRDDIESTRQVFSGPTGADDSSADYGDATYWFIV